MNAGPGISVRKRRTYTVIHDDLFVEGMSARAWGIFCYLQSRPDGWICYASQLCTVFKEGRDAIYTALAELHSYGLLGKEKYKDATTPNLTRQRYVMDLDPENPRLPRSAPETDFQEPETPDSDVPDAEKPDVVITEAPTTDRTTTETPKTPPAARSAGSDALFDVDQPPPPPPKDETLAQRAERVTKTWWDARLATEAELPTQSYIAVKGVITTALKNNHPEAEIVGALDLLMDKGKPISGGTLRVEMTELRKRQGNRRRAGDVNSQWADGTGRADVEEFFGKAASQ